MAKLKWKADEFGRQAQALYYGGIFVGSIMRVVPGYDWRKAFDVSESIRKHHERLEATPWRGWLMTTEEGDAIGYYASDDEARAAVEAKFCELTMENSDE